VTHFGTHIGHHSDPEELPMQVLPEMRLDAREDLSRVPSQHSGLSVFLRHLPPPDGVRSRGAVLYVHGATFPSALSIAHRFDGRSWRDELCAAGFDVWAFDFLGYGSSDRYPGMTEAADGRPPLCRAGDANRQIEAVVRAIRDRQGVARISIVAHSWGTIAAGCFACRCPDLIDRLIFFGPIAWRNGVGDAPALPAWRSVTLREQWDRFTAEVPDGESPVLSRRHFSDWGERYLDSDPVSREQTPVGVRTPSGPWFDIARAHHGDLAYDPAQVRAPVAIIRGEWDSLCTDADAAWLMGKFTSSPLRRDVKIGRGTHLMHLEVGRYALYRETEAFLCGDDTAPDE
jgi:pimeloyl-ACP methyl ester carboxylesterase